MSIQNLKLSVGIALVAMFFFTAGSISAQSNGGFENGECSVGWNSLSAGSMAIPGWTVGGAGVDWICTYWQPSEGLRSIDLNNLDAGSLSQDAETVAGYTYWLKFDLSGNPDGIADTNNPWFSPSLKVVAVSVGGADPEYFSYDTAVEGNTHADMKWAPQSLVFIADADSTSMNFDSQIPGAFGPALDDVRLEIVTEVCHRNFGKAPFKTLSPDLYDVADHIRHGDAAGPCPAE